MYWHVANTYAYFRSLFATLGNADFKLRISAHALKSVEHRGGLDAFLAKARNEELSEQCLKIKRDIAKAKADQQPAA